MSSIGHDYLDDAEERYKYLHAPQRKLAFDIDKCNEATKGGVGPKTLNILAAGVHVGKTLGLCHLASGYMKAGKNVLYITLEIDKYAIGYRIDCNNLNLTTDEADAIPMKLFMEKMEKLTSSSGMGRLKIEEYSAGAANVNTLNALLYELRIKEGFVPDVVLIDYLNLMASARVKASDKTHITIMAVAEELRGAAQTLGIPFWSATQLDAGGIDSSEPGMTNIAGSKVGLAATCDLLWTLVCTEKLIEMGQIMVIQQILYWFGS
jgi:replicative DNA helicase